MSTVMTEVVPEAPPAEERRGGEAPDWDRVAPGQPLPGTGGDPCSTLDDDDSDAAPLYHWCGRPGCGGD
jgi:hypothetical protein